MRRGYNYIIYKLDFHVNIYGGNDNTCENFRGILINRITICI